MPYPPGIPGDETGMKEDLIGGRCATHSQESIVIWGVGAVGPGEAVDHPTLSGGYRDDENRSAQAIEIVVMMGKYIPHVLVGQGSKPGVGMTGMVENMA